MTNPSKHRLDARRIAAARMVIDPIFLKTPQYISDPMSQALGVKTMLKVETTNPIRCFKGRGADLFVSGLESGSHVITASAGNLGQAMAYAARRHGAKMTVFAAQTANTLKIERMRGLGAEVILAGHDFDAAKQAAKDHAAQNNALMVEDGVEIALSEGAGTIGLELLESETPPDVIIVALGNGAILGGVARAVKANSPETTVIGVAAGGAPCMERSWRTGKFVQTEAINTIADGIGTRTPVPEALEDIRMDVDDVFLVSDEAMIEWMRKAHSHLGLVLEPSAAAGFAAIAANSDRFAGQTVATVLCGGNLTTEQMEMWLS